MIVGTEFQFKLKFLSFGPNSQKGHFWSKRAKLIVSIKFCIFELFYNDSESI